MHKKNWLSVVALLLACAATNKHAQAAPDLPILNWQERSDWLNVVTECGANGSDTLDDTAAIQSALNQNNNSYRPKPVYLPAGTYYISSTLHLTQNLGGLIVGHGRNTRIVWTGVQDGIMFLSNGNSRFRYVGISWDGNNIAGVGIDHASTTAYETRIRHQNEKFTNFRIAAIRGGQGSTNHTAEIYFDNCLFYRCTRGYTTAMKANFYNNMFVGCEFQDNEYGIYTLNAYVRNCHFERSSVSDMYFSPHSYSVRHCTSVGSKRFITGTGSSNNLQMMIQDCRVSGWTATDGAISSASRGPLVIFDNTFTNPPNTAPPIKLSNFSGATQAVVHSKNTSAATSALFNPGLNSSIYEVIGGVRGPSNISATTSFFRQTAFVPSSIIDVKTDFGAVGNNIADDTTPIRNAILAAKATGNNCLVYFPQGEYKVTGSLDLQGPSGNYSLGGSGYRSILRYSGLNQCFVLKDPKNLRIEHMNIDAPINISKIRHFSTPATVSSVVYDGIYSALGGKQPFLTTNLGLDLQGLPAEASVLVDHFDGHIALRNCSESTVLINQMIDGTLKVINSNNTPRTGFLGINTRIASNNDYDQVIYDNESVVIGDLYSETTDHSLNTQNTTNTGTGRITIRYSKMGTLNNDVFTIGNYRGRISIFGGSFYPQNPTTLNHSGTSNPTTIIFCGNAFVPNAPVLNGMSSNVNLVAVKNILTVTPTSLWENSFNSSGATELAYALDDFRQLGQVDLAKNFGM
jgi:hypothetical protein